MLLACPWRAYTRARIWTNARSQTQGCLRTVYRWYAPCQHHTHITTAFIPLSFLLENVINLVFRLADTHFGLLVSCHLIQHSPRCSVPQHTFTSNDHERIEDGRNDQWQCRSVCRGMFSHSFPRAFFRFTVTCRNHRAERMREFSGKLPLMRLKGGRYVFCLQGSICIILSE